LIVTKNRKQLRLSIRLSQSELDSLDRYAGKIDKNRSDAVRAAIHLATALIAPTPSVVLPSQTQTDGSI
jgi:uncharacterized protein (DUF1778 family)